MNAPKLCLLKRDHERDRPKFSSSLTIWQHIFVWFNVSTLAMIKSVAFSLPGKINVQCPHVGTPAPLIEPQLAWNIIVGRRTGGLDLDVLQCRCNYRTQMGRSEECTKIRISRPKMKNNYGEGELPLFETPPKLMGQFPLPPHTFTPSHRRLRRLYSCSFSAWRGPRPNPNSGSPLGDDDDEEEEDMITRVTCIRASLSLVILASSSRTYISG